MYRVYAYVEYFGDYMVDENLELRDFSYPYECIWDLSLNSIIERVGLDSQIHNYIVSIYDANTDELVAEGRGKNLCKIK